MTTASMLREFYALTPDQQALALVRAGVILPTGVLAPEYRPAAVAAAPPRFTDMDVSAQCTADATHRAPPRAMADYSYRSPAGDYWAASRDWDRRQRAQADAEHARVRARQDREWAEEQASSGVSCGYPCYDSDYDSPEWP